MLVTDIFSIAFKIWSSFWSHAEQVVETASGTLTGPSKVSPEIKARVPEKLKRALQKEAKRQGQTTSAVIRQALEEYLDTA